MSKSAAKKMRLKLEREGKRNPEIRRQTWSNMNPVEKKTPTLIEKQERMENKHKKNGITQPNRDDSIFIFYSGFHPKESIP